MVSVASIPNFSVDDSRFMADALRLGRRGIYTTHPNPRVGCVLVKNGIVIGEGWHEKAGQAHAEIIALQQAGRQARDATAYVTLEPCAHHGRTPPCAEALIESGVKEVIIAMQDPNPLVAGKGIQLLEQAHIQVKCGLLEQQALELNRGFVSRMKSGRPWVTVKLGASLDGRTAMSDGASQWITGSQARMDVQRLRAASSAVLTGSGTILADNPTLNVRIEGATRQPLRVVMDSHLSTPDSAKIFHDGYPLLVATSTSEDDDRYQQLQSNGIDVRCFHGQDGRVDALSLLQCLAEDFSCNELLVEAGAVVCGSLLAQQLVDEIVLYLAPVIMGSDARGLFDIPGLKKMSQKIELTTKDVRAIGRDWRVTVKPHYR
jgi:diaminohydroxyphosphoribosylaminopyrimidine deaminase/5-amino-6-(5-phosphoribosylamino)uracil reductase